MSMQVIIDSQQDVICCCKVTASGRYDPLSHSSQLLLTKLHPSKVYSLCNYLWHLECDFNGLHTTIDGAVANGDGEYMADNAAVLVNIPFHYCSKQCYLTNY